MRTSFISTLTLTGAPRSALFKLQTDLANASKELTTGRRADLGLALGVGLGETVALRREHAALQSYMDGNAAARSNIERTQTALDDIRGGADSFLQMTVTALQADAASSSFAQQARGALDALTSTLNVADGRRYLFGGVNSGEKPVAAFEDGPEAAIRSAFAARFGLDPADPQHDPAVANIPAADLADFIDTQLAGFFDEAGWSATWSKASSQNRQSAISATEQIETGASANEPAMRKLAMAYTIVGALGGAALKGDASRLVFDKARDLAGAAIGELTTIGTRLGAAQNRIDAADEMMRRALDVTDRRVSVLEAVDPAEAKTRLDMLSTQIEMSFSLTSRILKMSILDYV